MTEEFHKPFIKSLAIVAFVTIFAMISSRYLVEYYYDHNFHPPKTLEFSSEQSQEQIYSSVVK
jgi:hypothetical protein